MMKEFGKDEYIAFHCWRHVLDIGQRFQYDSTSCRYASNNRNEQQLNKVVP